MKSEGYKEQGLSHVLVLLFFILLVTATAFSYYRIKKTSSNNPVENNNQTNSQESDNSLSTTEPTNVVSDGPMVLDENTFSKWGVKFIGDKNTSSNVVFVSKNNGSDNAEYVYGYYDKMTTGADGSVVVQIRKKEAQPNYIIAVTKDLIEYGKSLKNDEDKSTFTQCLGSPFGGYLTFWTKQEVDEALRQDPNNLGPTYYTAQYLKEKGNLIGTIYPHYQQETGGCGLSVEVHSKVQENIKSTTKYISDNLIPLN